MAILTHRRSGHRHVLFSEHLVGRGSTCHLRVDSRLVSSAHAQLRWKGTSWEVHDLDSRNGTFVNGRRLDRGEHVAVLPGVGIAFGDPQDVFDFADDSPPIAHAVNTRGDRQDAHEQRLLALPSPANPVYTIFERDGQWLVEDDDEHGEQRTVYDGQVLTVGDDAWTLHLPVVVDETGLPESAAPMLCDLTLRFSVSRDQERIGLRLIHTGGTVELTSRVHMETLLRLAEIRVADRGSGLAQSEHGWVTVPEFLRRLGLPNNRKGHNSLCQHICQARRQLTSAGILGAMELIQRRTTIHVDNHQRVGQGRLGTSRIEIHFE